LHYNDRYSFSLNSWHKSIMAEFANKQPTVVLRLRRGKIAAAGGVHARARWVLSRNYGIQSS